MAFLSGLLCGLGVMLVQFMVLDILATRAACKQIEERIERLQAEEAQHAHKQNVQKCRKLL